MQKLILSEFKCPIEIRNNLKTFVKIMILSDTISSNPISLSFGVVLSLANSLKVIVCVTFVHSFESLSRCKNEIKCDACLGFVKFAAYSKAEFECYISKVHRSQMKKQF